ncbi:MAG: hypothetical protein JXR63_00885 [Spirochaetales bacterium]|nr:hypothetical protein [Spirochaetales bacterium]
MDTEAKIIEMIAEILDLDQEEISGESYMVRDLEAESIDLLELAVELNSAFKMKIDENMAFLKTLRVHIKEAADNGSDAADAVAENFPYLSTQRIKDILLELANGPVLKVKDIANYIQYKGN